MARFGQILSAMITPFDEHGALDLDEARRLARWLQEQRHDGLVIAGTTGEAPVLTDDERLSLFAAVIEAVSIPVIAGTGTNDTAHSVHLTKEAAALGAAGVLAVCPYYNRPSQAGIEGHMARLRRSSRTLPMASRCTAATTASRSRCSPAASSARSVWPRTGPAPTIANSSTGGTPVSYTHLTLPTKA